MDNINVCSKTGRGKTIDTINLGGKYVDRDALAQKVITTVTTSVFAISFLTFLILLLS